MPSTLGSRGGSSERCRVRATVRRSAWIRALSMARAARLGGQLAPRAREGRPRPPRGVGPARGGFRARARPPAGGGGGGGLRVCVGAAAGDAQLSPPWLGQPERKAETAVAG